MTSITVRATEDIGIGKKESERAKNMFALGLLSWMYGRPAETTLNWLERKFGGKQEIFDANVAAFKAGYNFGETTELFAHSYLVKAAPAEPGTYRNIAGSTALSWGLIAAGARSGLPLFYASYPITPASELLHELSRHKNFGVMTLQAEDEIAAANMALGAAFAGHLAVTGTSGPGMDLKAETLGLAAIMELPMIIVDVQRGGPSTGLPTKTEQSDLPAGDVRSSRRVATADPRAVFTGRLLRHRDRGCAHRRHVPHAGDPASRTRSCRTRRNRGRSRMPTGSPRSSRGSPRPRRTATGSCPTSATRSSRGHGRRPARPAWSTASAGWSARTEPGTSATTR